MPEAIALTYDEIEVGKVCTFQRTISQEDVLVFSELTGDRNPLHVNKEFGARSKFGKNIAHGMLAGSLFSTLVGMYCPGERSLYMSQTLNFRHPLFAGDTILVKGTVTAKHNAIKLVVMKTEILRGSEIIVTGEAKVQMIDGTEENNPESLG